MAKSELYFSVDVETDGPIPGPHSMLSLGAAAFLANGEMDKETFSVTLETLEGATGHPDTMRWWGQPEQAEAWMLCRQNPKSPQSSMRMFADWVKRLCDYHQSSPVFVAWPASFDFMFVHWYLVRFLGDEGRDLFSFSALDIKSYAMAKLQSDFRPVLSQLPKAWRDSLKGRHVALDDAIEQGRLFCKLLNDI